MKVLQTERLTLRWLAPFDAELILELVNDPLWLRFIGDRGVKTLEDARRYIQEGPVASYDRFGFGLYLTQLTDGAVPVGICGLIRRETLDDVDVGFALLPRHRGRGYAHEAAAAVLAHARDDFGLRRVVAITTPDNVVSGRLLEKLGFRFERMVTLTDEGSPSKLFGSEL